MTRVYFRIGETIIILDTWLAFLIIFLIIFIIAFPIAYIKEKNKKKRLKKANLDNYEITDFYFRDIPFKDIKMALYVSIYYGISDNLSDFIGAMLLKWIKEDKINIFENEGQTFIDMRKIFKTSLGFESSVYVKLLACANQNRILEENEFKNFFKNSEKTIDNLFNELKKEVEVELQRQGLITKSKNEYGYEKITPTKLLDQKAIELQGLKNFLEHFSSIEDKNSINVHLWDDYLIYAQLFGIADKVEAEFKEIYPDYNKMINTNLTKVALVNSLAVSLKLTLQIFTGSIRSRD